ncbi:MAG: hypothetical protein KDA59_12180, partial [Planctomycetales bacterium]|nr:hypothetical protein [Planctomycetales bacterium]
MDSHQLAAGVRTVRDVARYFDELKAKAAELAIRIPPQQRGYFTPAEEDETVGLLVSYWQARNALFDLITSYRLDEQLSDEDRPAAFLTAFSAALVLIDAARFLRETVHCHRLVRDKLNQPFPQFGVPEGVYDQVQASMLSARHAWHLYFAIQYFQQHEPALRAMAVGTELEPLVELIDSRRHQVDISLARFARARWRTRVSQFTSHLARDLLWRALYGIQKLGGTLVADRYLKRGHRPGLPKDVADSLQAALRPGDVLVVRKEYALTNYFLPGYWPHAALYLGDVRTLATLGIQDHRDVRPRWAKLLDASLGGSTHRV